MSNVINPVAERALDMALRLGGTASADELVARAKTFEKYINQDRPALDDFEDIIKAARMVSAEISLKMIPTQNEEILMNAVRKVFDRP